MFQGRGDARARGRFGRSRGQRWSRVDRKDTKAGISKSGEELSVSGQVGVGGGKWEESCQLTCALEGRA